VYTSKSRLGDGAGDYLVDHSIMFYVMDDNGQFVDYFGKSLSPEEITDKMYKYMTGTADETTHSDSSIGTLPMPTTVTR
jgi:cytochrome oxidase Cu insertion factor (SCO1/SenC/PrrC family)